MLDAGQRIYGGGAELKPIRPSRSAASLEYYFGRNSIFNFAVFRRIKDKICHQLGAEDPGHRRPRAPVPAQPPDRQRLRKVKSIEINLQHFMDNGFGSVQAQYTRNWAKRAMSASRNVRSKCIAPSVYSLGVFYDHGPKCRWPLGHPTAGFTTAVNCWVTGYNEKADPIT